jgi:hypothetical protein
MVAALAVTCATATTGIVSSPAGAVDRGATDSGDTRLLRSLPPPIPASAGPLDTSRPTTVVGRGSAATCTEAALRAAVAAGGVVRFRCGPATATIRLTRPLVAPADKNTVIDGRNLIVLDGGGRTQILRSTRQNFRVNDRYLAVQRLRMVGGRDIGTGFRARDGQKKCAWGYREGGGGAIHTRDVNVRVWDVTFLATGDRRSGPTSPAGRSTSSAASG